MSSPSHSFFFFNDTATTEIYTLSLHDALPICSDNITTKPRVFRVEYRPGWFSDYQSVTDAPFIFEDNQNVTDRKSTRLNSSHMSISYAVFCLKKKKKYTNISGHVTRWNRTCQV